MRDNDGRKLDHKTLEQLRIRAVRQIEHGVHPEQIAQALGMTRAAVYSWLAKYREGGLDALKARPVPGRPPKLSGAQLRRLYRAYQQNPEAVQRWRVEDYPQIRAEAQQVGATIWFADEAGVRSDYHAGTTWAPVGQTPVVMATGDRVAINLISAVTAKGALRFAAYDGNLNSPVFIDFCRRLLHDAPGPVFLVLDGHPVHRSNAVKAFAASTNGRLRLFFLPGYSPELNPDEWVWKNVKHDRIGRAGVSGLADLKAKALAALHRLQKLPHLVQGFFRDLNLRSSPPDQSTHLHSP